MAKKKTTKAKTAGSDIRTIEQLQEDYNRLNERRIRAQSELDNAEERLKELQNEADDKFNTHDVKELEEMLRKMEVENETRRADYQKQLEGIHADLQKIEAEEVDVPVADEQ